MSSPTTPIDAAGELAGRRREVDAQHGDVLRRHAVEPFGRRIDQVAGDHPADARPSHGRECVDAHAELGELDGARDRERGDTRLRGDVHRVVRHGEEPDTGRGVDDATSGFGALRSPVRRGPVTDRGGAGQVDGDRALPVELRDRVDRREPRDARVVEDDVEPTEARERGVDQPAGAVPIGDVARVGDRLPAGFGDRGDDLVSRVGRCRAFSRHLAAEIVDDDRGTLGRERERMGAADAATRASDDRDLPVELTHHATSAARRRGMTSCPNKSCMCLS